MSQEDLEIVRRSYDAFNRGDYAAVVEALDSGIVWEEPDLSGVAFSGEHHGREHLVEKVFEPVRREVDDFEVVPEEFLDAKDHVVVLGRYRGHGKDTGVTLTPASPMFGRCATGRPCGTGTTTTRRTGCAAWSGWPRSRRAAVEEQSPSTGLGLGRGLLRRPDGRTGHRATRVGADDPCRCSTLAVARSRMLPGTAMTPPRHCAHASGSRGVGAYVGDVWRPGDCSDGTGGAGAVAIGVTVGTRPIRKEVGAVPLLPHEQFVLRRIERQLTEADPALATYLSGRVRWRWLAAVAVIYTVLAVLLGLGMGAHLVAVLVAGALLAPVAPWVSWWALLRRKRRTPPTGDGDAIP